MANFTASNLVAGQAVFTAKMQEAEFRAPDIAALSVASKANAANPFLADLRTREDRAVKALMPIRKPASTSGTSRTYNHTGNRGDSQVADISWSTFAETFSISLKQAGNNVLKWQEMYAASKRSAVLNILERLDAFFVAQLVASKSQVNAGGGNGTFDGTTTYDYQVPLTEKDYFFQNAKATTEFNLYRGDLIGLVDDRAKMIAERLMAQGSANATNFGFQFAGMTVVPTTRSILSGYIGSGLFFKNGYVGVIPWIPPENRKPIDPRAAMSTLGAYGSFTVPEIGMTLASHVYAERADTSALNGDTQDVVIQEELSVDLGVVVAPLSTANETPILSVGQLNA